MAEAPYPTDPWARKIRQAIDGERTFDTGGAENQRAQLEELAQAMDQGATFEQAVAMSRGEEPPSPEEASTIGQLKIVGNRIKEIMAKPMDTWTPADRQYVQRGTTMIKAYQGAVQGRQELEEAGVDGAAAFEGQRVEGMGPLKGPHMVRLQKLHDSAKRQVVDFMAAVTRPFMDDDEANAFAHQLRLTRAKEDLQAEADAIATGVDPEALSGPDIVGELIPTFVVGGAPGLLRTPRTIAGALQRVALEVGAGTWIGASEVPLDEDPTNAMLLDGGITMGMGMLSEMPGLAADLMRREMRRAVASPTNREMLEIEKEAGIQMSLGERTQSAALRKAEAMVPDEPTGVKHAFFEQQARQIEASFNKTINALNPDKDLSYETIAKARGAYDKHIGDMSNKSWEAFQEDMIPSMTNIGATFDRDGNIVGGPRFYQPQELLRTLWDQRNRLRDQPLAMGKNALKQLDDEISRMMERGMNLGEIQRLMKDLSRRNAPSGMVIPDYSQPADIIDSRAIQRALDRDMDAMIESDRVPLEYREVLSDLKRARADYSTRRKAIDGFRYRAIDQLLGGKLDPSAPDFARNLLNMDHDSFVDLIHIADKASPGLGNAMRGVVWKEMIDDATKIGATKAEEVVTGRIIDAVNNMPASKRRAFLNARGLNDQQLAQMSSTLRVLKAIEEGPSKGVDTRGMLQRAEQWAINAASRDVGFVSRLLAGEISPGLMERLLFTEAGQNALTTLGGRTATRSEIATAFSQLSVLYYQDEEQRKQTERMRLASKVGDIGAL